MTETEIANLIGWFEIVIGVLSLLFAALFAMLFRLLFILNRCRIDIAVIKLEVDDLAEMNIGEKIVRLETMKDNIIKEIDEIKSDNETMWHKINQLNRN